MPETRETLIRFQSEAFEEDTFRVVALEGEEHISRLYRFELELISEDAEIDLDALLGKPAKIEIEREGVDPRTIHGVLAEVGQGESGAAFTHYRVVLVPRLWWLGLSTGNQVHQDRTVQEILTAEFKAGGLQGSEYDFLLDGPRSKGRHEYRVQYNETNLDFVHRQMEHEGFFYFFQQDSGAPTEKLLVCDRSGRVPAIEEKMPFRPPSGLDEVEEESVFQWQCRVVSVAEKILMRDYNYRTPKVDLATEAPVPGGDIGRLYEYGAHYKSPGEGRELAMVRAEEEKCRRVVFRGHTNCIRLTAGHRVELEDHPRADFNGAYLVVSVKHRVVQAVPGDASQGVGGDGPLAYRNDVEAIPFDVPYRPPRVTPKPRLYGVMNAVVEGETSTPYAEIDDLGRYKVRMAFDVGDADAGRASRYLRMASPYAGESEGATFPLRKNTEVLWACIDGDPDRPVILGAVPNPATPNQVTEGNRSQSVIRTASGVLIEFNDSIPS